MLRRTRRRMLTASAIFVMVAAACTGGSSDEPTTVPSSTPVTQSTEGSTVTGATSTSVAETIPTGAVTTTTEPDPLAGILPVGAVWQTSTPIDEVADLHASDLAVIDGTTWLVGRRENRPLALRSVDGGPWEEIDLGPGPADGDLELLAVVAAGDKLLLYGEIGSDCGAGTQLDNGDVRGHNCRVFQGVTFVSTDGGTTFTRHEPAEFALGGRQSVRIKGMVHDGEQFVAVGTLRAVDWHGRMWTSPDGINWSVARELRGTNGAMSAVDVVFDGDTYLVVALEHPCSTKGDFRTSGFVLGATWRSHVRFLIGSELSALVPLTTDDVAIVPAPLDLACAAEDGFTPLPYPDVEAFLIGSTLTLVDISDEFNGGTPGVYPTARLDGGTWTTTTITTDPETELVAIGDAAGLLAFVEKGAADRDVATFKLTIADGDSTTTADAVNPVLLQFGVRVAAISQVGDEIWVVATEPNVEERTGYIRVWSSGEATLDDLVPCEPGPGARCVLQQFALVAGYPDFTDADLSGIDARYADFGAGVYSGASFRDADLEGAESDSDASFVGTDFTGADLSSADLDGLDGVILDGANLHFADLEFDAPPVSLATVDLSRARLGFAAAAGPLDLSGLDLTNATIGAVFGDDLLVIGDLSGAVLDGLSLSRVDLRGAALNGVDLSLVNFDDQSICPDGSVPVGEGAFRRTCG